MRHRVTLTRDISKERELEDLKARAASLQARIQSLSRRIGQMNRGRAPSPMVAVVNEEKCVGCGTCESTCPAGAIRVEKTAQVDPRRCLGCGICAETCPKSAIELRPLRRRAWA